MEKEGMNGFLSKEEKVVTSVGCLCFGKKICFLWVLFHQDLLR